MGVLAAAVIMLAACASGTDQSGSGGGEPAEGKGGLTLKPVDGYATSPPDSLVEAARAEGGELVWYENTPSQEISKVTDKFVERYPWATVRHVKLGGSILNGRVAQEVQADAASADAAMNDAGPELAARDMLLPVDWDKLGMPEGMPRTKYAIASASSIYAIHYNTNLVSDEEAPKSFKDLLDPKWKGKIAYYAQPYFFSHLVTAWGEQRTTEYVDKFAEQSPRPYDDTDQMTQAVASGDTPIALSVYHSYLRAKADELPVAANIPEPTTMTLLYSYIPRTAEHPNTGKLFLNWLNSKEGQKVYTDVARRGNPLFPDSEYGRLVEGKEMVSWGPNEAEEQTEWLEKFADRIQRGR